MWGNRSLLPKSGSPTPLPRRRLGRKGQKEISLLLRKQKKLHFAERQADFLIFPPSRSAFSERREETVLEHRRRGPRIIIFAGGEISSFFIFRIYPIGFLGGGAWEPLFGLPESGSPAIYLFLLSSSIPWGRRGIGWAPADRRSHTRRGRPAGWAGG